MDVRPDQHVVADVDAAQVHRGAPVVDEDVAPEAQVAPRVHVERREHAHRRVDLPPGQLAQERAQTAQTEESEARGEEEQA